MQRRKRVVAFRLAVMPNALAMPNTTGSATPGASQSKWNNRLASASSKDIPGHILRPAPKGRSSKSAPLISTVPA